MGKGQRKTGFKVKAKSRDGWIVYLMVHFPFVWWWKIGTTGRSATARAEDIDEAVFGFPVPVFVVWMPGAYLFEQFLHRLCRGLHVDFYKGDGHTEWFWIPAVIIALPFMLAVWAGYAWLISQATNWDALEWYLMTLQILAGWAIQMFR